MKICSIALLGLLLSSQIMAMELYKGYQLYKDPAVRSRAAERMQQAKIAAQQKLEAGWERTKEFAQRHKKELIRTGVAVLALAAITLAKLGYDKKQRNMLKKKTESIYRSMNVGEMGPDLNLLSNDETLKRVIGYGDMAQGLGSLNAVKNRVASLGKNMQERAKWIDQFNEDVEYIPNLKEALEKLAAQ